MSEIPPQLREVAERLKRDEKVRRKKIEDLLKWFGAARRGSAVILNIREALDLVGLETDPDFTEGAVEDFVVFRLVAADRKSTLNEKSLDQQKLIRTKTTELLPSITTQEESNELNDGFWNLRMTTNKL